MFRFQTHDDGAASLVGTRAIDLDRMRRFFARIHRTSDHYRGVMDRSGLSAGDSPVDVLGRFPPTSREEYREVLGPEALARLSRDRFVCDYSSGSTGRCARR